MEEFIEFINTIYNKPFEECESFLFVRDEFFEVKYDAEYKNLKFSVTYDDYESKSRVRTKEIAVKALCEILTECKIEYEHNYWDGMGAPFVDELIIIETEKYSVNDFLKVITKVEKKEQEIICKRKAYSNGYRPISKHVKFRPKARLLSILGEQLISNEVIAIKELVLNAYDAGAEKIYINFHKDNSDKIISVEILDNGNGMTEERIIQGWFTPATSLKSRAKKEKSNRPILGEKGVGRFASRRLGSTLEVRTKPVDLLKEFYFNIEWSQYDVDDDDIYLDEIENIIYSKEISKVEQITLNDVFNNFDIITSTLNNFDKGTSIKISNLKDNWNTNKIETLKSELIKLIPPFMNIKNFKIFIDNKEIKNEIFLEKALYYIEGIIDLQGNLYYMIGKYPRNTKLKPGEFINNINFNNNIEEQINQLGCEWKKTNLLELNGWEEYIREYKKSNVQRQNTPFCGNFTFCAYAWDLDSIHKKKVGINDKYSRDLLRNLCGISIFRDGFRIWPYGSIGNDWLNLDKRAQGGQKPFHIANHQVIGYVGVTEEYNPYFKDTSNREGIINQGYYFADLKMLVLLSFSFLERVRYDNNRQEGPKKEKEWWTEDKVLHEFKQFSQSIEEKAPELLKDFKRLENVYSERKKQTESKIENLLEVSSSGVVFESVTHELISFLNKMDEQSKEIENFLSCAPPARESALQANILLKEALNIVLYEVKELQPFFKAARYQQKEHNIKEIAEKAMKYFKYRLKNNSISYQIVELSLMKKKAVEGFLLQIFSNLIDNSIYWLDNKEYNNKQILITVDGNNNALYFSDNGTGVRDEVKNYVFDAFFTEKKEGEGRGLGLYIVQELLSNYGANITITDEFKPPYCNQSRKGTSFKITFI